MSLLTPRHALNKAFLKVKPTRTQIDIFKSQLIQLLEHRNDQESEEFHKNLISDFFKNTAFTGYFINTKGRNDLVIHNGKIAKDSVGVIIEVKKLSNKTEMLSTKNINSKALQELVLYYLRERITGFVAQIKFELGFSLTPYLSKNTLCRWRTQMRETV